MSENRSTPRVAESLDDLRVGQVVICRPEDGEWRAQPAFEVLNTDPETEFWTPEVFASGVVILADPPTPPAPDWLVPADTMAELREEVDRLDRPTYPKTRIEVAARAVLDAARPQEADQ